MRCGERVSLAPESRPTASSIDHLFSATFGSAEACCGRLLREMAAAHNSGEPDRVSDWFTEDFRLHEPGVPSLPVGHEGASQMRARFKTLTPPINLEILDMIEEGDRVAVRWQLTASYDGRPFEQPIMAIYRFENGRIAEDWGISTRALWP